MQNYLIHGRKKITGSRKHLDILEEEHHSVESKAESVESSDKEEEEEENQISADDLAALTLDTLRMRYKRRKDSGGTGRRSSDGGNGELKNKIT